MMLNMMKAVLAATIALATFGAGPSSAFTLGSLARAQSPLQSSGNAGIAYPAVCFDAGCGTANGKASDFEPLSAQPIRLPTYGRQP